VRYSLKEGGAAWIFAWKISYPGVGRAAFYIGGALQQGARGSVGKK